MHEISLIRSTFRTLAEEFSEVEFKKITDIHLKIGQLANVEPILLQNAFEAVVSTEFANQPMKLHIEWLPTLIKCPVCQHTSEVTQYRFVCQHCQRPCSQVVQGNELLIGKVELSS
ncbi:MAG: hydrogenase maturation nickel metallochaperone HypA [Microscillaceae bacterium]|nr:hydrogenase maturation nickel metallochaperone HypA [Microscillaceae bacterium]